jgi:putative transposase
VSKYRRQVLVKGADIRLKAIIRDVCRERSAELIEVEVMPDLVRLLVDVDPQLGIHRLVKAIKGRSSRLDSRRSLRPMKQEAERRQRS